MTDYTQQLAGFLAGLRHQDLPPAVLARMEELFLDWLGSALAGKGQHPIPLFERYAERMAPADGSAQISAQPAAQLAVFRRPGERRGFHVVEQDDLHNSSVLHPAAVVFLLPWPRPRTSAAAAPS
ncbi:MmgE/PrpD family protein [Pseudomonas aeruginosa]|nr:MmgE/PrpD family protein [Pseudomonas aeruginosa]